MIKLIISDLDGTFVHNHSTIREEDILALRHAAEQGIEVAFASGRMYPEIVSVMERIGGRNHSISQNGAYAHLTDGSMIVRQSFERELLLSIMDSAEETAFLSMLAAPDYYFVERITAHAQRIQGRLFAPFHEVPDARRRIGGDMLCGKFSLFGEVEELRAFKPELEARFGDAIEVYISDIDCMDIMPSGVSKGSALRALRQELSLLPEETACIGDSFNDLSMFAETPHSFAMAGSHSGVRAMAAHTTAGVAEVIDWAIARNKAEA
jgi:Cof subfamily protein (haloacid dehalogenase superfamily)